MNKVKLTTSERGEIDAICAQALSRAYSTEAMDEAACRSAVEKAYALRGVTAPEIVFCLNPFEAMARLQRLSPDTGSPVPRPVPDVQKVLEDGRSFAGIWDVIVAAQPRVWPALGPEVDLSFHSEIISALDSIPWGSEAWAAVKRRVETKVFDLCHLAHTVTDRLEQMVKFEPEAWLLYTQAAASFWAEASQYVELEAAAALGHVRTLPPEFATGRDLLASCGWVYAFERLCPVCDRPVDIQQSKHKREVRTGIEWRDGARCDRVFS